MGGRDISITKRSEIITLIRENRYSNREIARRTGVSKSTISRYREQFRNVPISSSNRTGHCGRKRKTTAQDDRNIVRNLRRNQFATARSLRNELADSGVQVTTQTIRNRLKEVGGRSGKPKKKPILTPRMKRQRLLFARTHRDWTIEDWKKVIYLNKMFIILV